MPLMPYAFQPTHLLLTRSGELPNNALCRVLIDFTMARYRLHRARNDISIPIVIVTVAHEYGAIIFDSANQVKALHAKASSPMFFVLSASVPSATISRISARNEISMRLSSSNDSPSV